MLCLAFGFNIITFISYPFLIFARKKGEGVLGRFLCLYLVSMLLHLFPIHS
jgi:hypothetical protein